MSLEEKLVWIELELVEPDNDETGDTNGTAVKQEVYVDDLVKDELVIGPESLQPPDVVFSLRGNLADRSDSVPIEQDNTTSNLPNELLQPREMKRRGRPKKRKRGRPKTSTKSTKEQQREKNRIYARRYAENHREATREKSRRYNYMKKLRETQLSEERINQKLLDPLETAIKTEPYRRQFKCDACRVAFARKGDLKRHKLAHGNKHYECNKCDYICTRRSDLKNESHLDKNIYKCSPDPDDEFIRKFQLTSHDKTHTGEKLFESDFACNQKGGLLHQRTRTGYKPYKCDECGSAFARSMNLKSHMKRHTGETFKSNQSQILNDITHIENENLLLDKIEIEILPIELTLT